MKKALFFLLKVIMILQVVIIVLSGPLYNYFWEKYHLPLSAIVYTLAMPMKGADFSVLATVKKEVILTIGLFIFI